jgi:shikimate kinase
VLNALATGTGSAFAIDRYLTATVELDPTGRGIEGEIGDRPDADTSLIERCVELVLEEVAEEHGVDPAAGGRVRTESEVPMASGLKSSSAAANATVLATLAALDAAVERETAARLGVRAAREVGVTVTGAFDDASASMLGGLTVTDNERDALLKRDTVDWDVLVWTPDQRAFSADADAERCRRVAPMADLVATLATDGRYGEAMTVNGLAFSAALEFPTEPMVEAMPHARGVSLSGTGPSVVAVGNRPKLETVRERWDSYDGDTWLTTTQNAGAERL